MDTFACGIVALILAIQWKWYINVRRDVKLLKKNLITGIIDRAHMDEVDIGDFSVLGQSKKPEAPKVWGCFALQASSGAQPVVPATAYSRASTGRCCQPLWVAVLAVFRN